MFVSAINTPLGHFHLSIYTPLSLLSHLVFSTDAPLYLYCSLSTRVTPGSTDEELKKSIAPYVESVSEGKVGFSAGALVARGCCGATYTYIYKHSNLNFEPSDKDKNKVLIGLNPEGGDPPSCV